MVNNNDFCFGFTPGEELTSRCFSYCVLETGCRTTEEQQSFVYLLLMKQWETLVQMLVCLTRLISVCCSAADEHTKCYYTPCSCHVVRKGSAACYALSWRGAGAADSSPHLQTLELRWAGGPFLPIPGEMPLNVRVAVTTIAPQRVAPTPSGTTKSLFTSCPEPRRG